VQHTITSNNTKTLRHPTFTPKGTRSGASRRADIHPLDRAIAELRNELARSPDDSTLHGRLGALFYRRGDLAEAEKCYRHALTLQPSRPSFHNNLANILCDRGQWKEGLACYERALALERAADPGKEPSAEATTNLELARLEYRLVHERIEYWERTTALEVDSAEALNALGGACLLRRERERALTAFRRAAQLDPRNVSAARNLAFAHTVDPNGPEDPQAALAELAEFAMRFPKEPLLFIHQGELLESAGLFPEAETQYVRALKADPRCLEVYDLLGRLRELSGAAGVRDEAARTVEALLDHLERDACARRREGGASSGPEPLYDLALVEVARARFVRRPIRDGVAVDALLREALHAAEEAGSARAVAGAAAAILRAQLLEADGRRDEATLVLESGCEKFPRSARLWVERGALCYRQGEIGKAVEAFERATLAEPQEAFAYQSLRFAFEGYRRYRTERVRFESAVKANPRDAGAHHHLGLAALSVLKDEEALFHFRRALELDPRLAEAACGIARALQRQGHLTEADAAARKALEIDPECREAAQALQSIAAARGVPAARKRP
jgi:tetratricopeptide (TPR) repeat protein